MFDQFEPGVVAAIVAAAGSVLSGLGGRWFGHRSAVRQIEAKTTERIADGYGDALEDLRAQVRESRADRQQLRDDMASLRLRVRDLEQARMSLLAKFTELLDHVRVLRTILRANQIDHPPGPAFLDE